MGLMGRVDWRWVEDSGGWLFCFAAEARGGNFGTPHHKKKNTHNTRKTNDDDNGPTLTMTSCHMLVKKGPFQTVEKRTTPPSHSAYEVRIFRHLTIFVAFFIFFFTNTLCLLLFLSRFVVLFVDHIFLLPQSRKKGLSGFEVLTHNVNDDVKLLHR